MFTNPWKQCRLGDTNSIYTDGNYGEAYPRKDELIDKTKGVPFLRGSNIKDGKLIEEGANYITCIKHEELLSGHLEFDDIVLTVRGSLGDVGYVEKENIGWNINSQLAIIRTDKNEIYGKFLIHFLLSANGKKELLSYNTGTALKQLPIKQLKNILIPITNITEQTVIADFFTRIDHLITLHQRKVEIL